jgi:hypothetical protein
MKQLGPYTIYEEQLDEGIGTSTALMFASALRYLGSGIPVIKDSSIIKKAAEIEQEIQLGRAVSMKDMESLRSRLMKDIDALPGWQRKTLKTYMTKLENRIKRDIKMDADEGKMRVDYDHFRQVLKRGQGVKRIAHEIDMLGLDDK